MDPRAELETLKHRMSRIEDDLRDARARMLFLERLVTAVPQTAGQPDESPRRAAEPPPLPGTTTAIPTDAASTRGAVEHGQVQPPPVPQPPPLAEENAPGWTERLRVWQLLPPQGEDNAEVRLGAWWATRIGALMAVIGVVFFAVYISVGTPPWVKFLELAGVAAGVALLGLRLERRFPAFGQVLLAAGLSIGHFTAYAGYALPAVKVMHSPWMAALSQVAAAAAMAWAAVWKRSPSMATIAVALGLASALFAHTGGMPVLALGTAAALGVLAVWLHRGYGWSGPSVLAMPGAYGMILLVSHTAWRQGSPPSAPWFWLCLGSTLVLFFLRDWNPWKNKESTSADPRGILWFQGLQSSLAIGLGVLATLLFHRGTWVPFYAGTSVLLAILAAAVLRVDPRDRLAGLFLAKSSGAAALAWICWMDSRSTATALLVQAWVMAWTARRLDSRVLRVGTLAAALLALGFHFYGNHGGCPVLSWQAARAVLFSLGLALLADRAVFWHLRENPDAGKLWHWIGAIAAAAAAIFCIVQWEPEQHTPGLLLGMAALFAVTGLAESSAASRRAAALVFLAANSLLWHLVPLPAFDGIALAHAAAIVAASLGLAGWARNKSEHRSVFLVALYLASTGTLFTIHNQAGVLPAFVSGAALGLLAARFQRSGDGMSWLATGCGFLAFLFWGLAGFPVAPPIWPVTAVLLFWLIPLAMRTQGGSTEPAQPGCDGLQIALATVSTWRLITGTLEGAAAIIALTAAVFWAAVFFRTGRVAMARPAALVLAVSLLWEMAGNLVFPGNRQPGFLPAAFAASCTGLILLPHILASGTHDDAWPGNLRNLLVWLLGCPSLALWFAVCSTRGGHLASFATIGWAAGGILLFLAGLRLRSAPHRLLGLIGLALCLPRLFLVDLDSALHRIIAFLALGLVFLWIGFSYHRFKHLIVGSGTDP